MAFLTEKRMADIGLFYCAAIWGSTFIVTKSALSDVNAVVMVGIRFLISSIILFPFVLRKKKPLKHMKEAFFLSFFLSVLYMTQTVGLVYTSASNSGFITGLFIIFIPVFLFLTRRERPTVLQGISALSAVCGLWLITGGISGINRGDWLTLIAATSYSMHLIVTDKYVKAEADTILLAFHQFWMVSLISFSFAGFSGYSFSVETWKGWGIISFLAVFPTLSAFYIQMLAQKKSEPFKVGLVFTLEPVFAALFAWGFGGEQFMWKKAAGGFMIFFGMVLGELSKFDFKRAMKKEVLPV